ncbi:aminopeptidase [Haloplanus pelagicus]|uniref:aminopeptidase n=1 Tax=Haloplanus pelagicus TaxID=2949995 RepID=UPI00203AA2E2|nr:aminopeptidase [Haloplanus sp. HW8-1]
MTDAERPLDVYADLTLDVGETTVSIRGYGDLVVVRAPSLRAVRALASGASRVPVFDGLSRADVTLDVRVRGHSVARAGPGHDPGHLSRVLGVDPARISPGGVVLSLFD